MPRPGMSALEKMVFLAKAVPDYNSGASFTDLSEKYNVPRTTIQGLFKQHGVKVRKRGRYRAGKHD